MYLRKATQYWRHYCHSAVSGFKIAFVTLFSFKLHLNAATVVLLYLLVIVWQSLAGGFALSATAAIIAALCLDFFFLPPLLSLRIADPPMSSPLWFSWGSLW
jgi:K+-sensing histidine kinase KdpD